MPPPAGRLYAPRPAAVRPVGYGVANAAFGSCQSGGSRARRLAWTNASGGTPQGQPVSLNGNELQNTPNLSVGLSGQYTQPLGGRLHPRGARRPALAVAFLGAHFRGRRRPCRLGRNHQCLAAAQFAGRCLVCAGLHQEHLQPEQYHGRLSREPDIGSRHQCVLRRPAHLRPDARREAELGSGTVCDYEGRRVTGALLFIAFAQRPFSIRSRMMPVETATSTKSPSSVCTQ